MITQFKHTGEQFFESPFLNYSNSFYTFHFEETKNIVVRENYIDKTDIKEMEILKDKITFIRITAGMASDIGRNYMKKILNK